MAKWTDAHIVRYYHRSFVIGAGLGAGFAFLSRGNKSWGKLFQEVILVAGGGTGLSMAYVTATRDKDY